MPQNFDLTDIPPAKPRRKMLFLFGVISLFAAFCVVFGALTYHSLDVASSRFPVNESITIEPGSTAREVADQFEEAGFVDSAFSLYVSLLWWHDPTTIKASTYVFATPLSPRELAREVTTGHFAHDLVSVTFPEGERASTIAAIAERTLPEFDAAEFIALAEPLEGKLFPDTYFLPESFTAAELFTLLTGTYNERVHIPYYEQSISQEELTEDEMLVLASIVEREANTPESMKLVSGILLNRMRIGMALQVDASMEYVLDKPLKELTAEDLDIDSLYNTYLYPGLPPTPIGNPGLTAIEAVIEPTRSDYFYYITGDDGEFYYARTFDEHRANIARHLR